jgi:hypothetical protein
MVDEHTWTWGEIKTLLVNPQEEIETFERLYLLDDDKEVITTAKSVDIEAWEIWEREGLRPILKPIGWRKLSVEELV